MRFLLTLGARVLPPPAFARVHCLAKLGYWPDLEEPRTFTERMLAKRAYDRDPLLPLTADKLTLRDYVAERVGEEYLPELYRVAATVDEVDLTGLPADYVMKGSHGSGWNRIVVNGDLDIAEARSLARTWLGRSFYWKRQEWAYKQLAPRVLFEEHLAPGRVLDDYKVFVFGGVPRLIQVDRDRFKGHRKSLFTPSWEFVAVEYEHPFIEEPVPAPAQLGQMLEVASVLGKPFDFVRVDMYALTERLVVGEMTHYPVGGVAEFDPRSFDVELGAVWGEGRPVSERYLRR